MLKHPESLDTHLSEVSDFLSVFHPEEIISAKERLRMIYFIRIIFATHDINHNGFAYVCHNSVSVYKNIASPNLY